jgi:hypothetical protein
VGLIITLMEIMEPKGSLKNNCTFLHPVFRSFSPDPQPPLILIWPRKSAAIPVVLRFRIEPIYIKYVLTRIRALILRIYL